MHKKKKIMGPSKNGNSCFENFVVDLVLKNSIFSFSKKIRFIIIRLVLTYDLIDDVLKINYTR